MENLKPVALLFSFMLLLALHIIKVDANFVKSTKVNWGSQNAAISADGQNLALMLTNSSGSGIQTKKPFLFGSIEVLIKLVPGNSAGTVTAYYMSSTGSNHDEIDFEFLGNVSGQPYIIHTNVYTQGVGNREQQFYPWFDPTADFHNYTIHWNPTQIVWYVDSIPIRVFRNYESMGIHYPKKQGMRVYSSIWNADNWATRGGLEKIDWNGAPFTARYKQLRLRACKWEGATSVTRCAASTSGNWWTLPAYGGLNAAQTGQMRWVRSNFMIYDYCRDVKRFNGRMPLECSRELV